jgi:hypothetical protein
MTVARPKILIPVLLGALLTGLAGMPPVAAETPSPGGGGPPADAAPGYPVRIHVPPEVGQAHTAEVDALGRSGRVTCVSCHAEREEPAVAPQAAAIDSVHTGMRFTHGDLSCFSCHDATSDYDRLRLADGTLIPYVEVVTLCSQCHGPQRKDFEHGAHGGMTGYWDLTRGPRDKNSCVVCHDAHAPAFPAMQPRFKPIDRFLSPASRPESPDGH